MVSKDSETIDPGGHLKITSKGTQPSDQPLFPAETSQERDSPSSSAGLESGPRLSALFSS